MCYQNCHVAHLRGEGRCRRPLFCTVCEGPHSLELELLTEFIQLLMLFCCLLQVRHSALDQCVFSIPSIPRYCSFIAVQTYLEIRGIGRAQQEYVYG